jgi:hypothetical protein
LEESGGALPLAYIDASDARTDDAERIKVTRRTVASRDFRGSESVEAKSSRMSPRSRRPLSAETTGLYTEVQKDYSLEDLSAADIQENGDDDEYQDSKTDSCGHSRY